MKKVAVTLLLLALAGCGPLVDDGQQRPDCTQVTSGSLSGVYRCVDEDAQVVCWVWTGYNQGGIDCMPFSEVRGTGWKR